MTTDEGIDKVNKDLMRYAGRQLKEGGDKSPLLDFIGRGVDWDAEPSPFGDGAVFVVFKFDKVEVKRLRPDAGPHPQDTAELKLKHSEAKRSGFGFFQASMNRALGIQDAESDLDKFKGETWYVHSEPYNWGKMRLREGQARPSAMDDEGNVWSDVYYISKANGQSTATVVETQPTAPVAEQDSESIALGILNGKTMSEAIPELVTHTAIQADATLMNSIIERRWLPTLEAAGKVVKDANEVYTVVA